MQPTQPCATADMEKSVALSHYFSGGSSLLKAVLLLPLAFLWWAAASEKSESQFLHGGLDSGTAVVFKCSPVSPALPESQTLFTMCRQPYGWFRRQTDCQLTKSSYPGGARFREDRPAIGGVYTPLVLGMWSAAKCVFCHYVIGHCVCCNNRAGYTWRLHVNWGPTLQWSFHVRGFPLWQGRDLSSIPWAWSVPRICEGQIKSWLTFEERLPLFLCQRS